MRAFHSSGESAEGALFSAQPTRQTQDNIWHHGRKTRHFMLRCSVHETKKAARTRAPLHVTKTRPGRITGLKWMLKVVG